MEGSMKMMSWSRYRGLSWSSVHAARCHHGVKIHKTRRRNRAFIDAAAAPRSAPDFCRAVQCFQFLIRMFRTRARPTDTDV
jgi:hypothetical protein